MADEPLDRGKRAFERLVRQAVPELHYAANYWARVVSQDGATIDVEIDQVVGIDGNALSMSKVPLTAGVPNATLTMRAGGRVLVGWSGCDPQQPYAKSFDVETDAEEVVLEADRFYVGGKDGAERGPLWESYRSAEDTFFTAMDTFLDMFVSSHTGVATLPQATAALNLVGPAAAEVKAALATFKAAAGQSFAASARLK